MALIFIAFAPKWKHEAWMDIYALHCTHEHLPPEYQKFHKSCGPKEVGGGFVPLNRPCKMPQ